MQLLHLVGFTTDLDGLIFSARRGTKSGGFTVEVDDEFVSRVLELYRAQGGDLRDIPGLGGPMGRGSGASRSDAGTAEASTPAGAAGPGAIGFGLPMRPRQSTLTPREIQARLRAGRTLGEVAGEAGVDEAWVGRFAAPILAEQARVIERAQAMVFDAPRKGPSHAALGSSVRRNLAERGIKLGPAVFSDGWSAYQEPDGVWVIRFGYVSRGRGQHAEWEIDESGDAPVLAPRNRLAGVLGYVERARRGRARHDDIDFSAPEFVLPAAEPASRPGGRSSTRGRAGPAAAEAERPGPARKPAAKKTAARKAAARKTTKKAATAKKLVPTKKAVPAKAAPGRKAASAAKAVPAKKAAAGKAAPSRKAASAAKAAAKKTPAKTAAAAKRTTTAARSAALARTTAAATKAAAKKTAPAKKASAKKAVARKAAPRASATRAPATRAAAEKAPARPRASARSRAATRPADTAPIVEVVNAIEAADTAPATPATPAVVAAEDVRAPDVIDLVAADPSVDLDATTEATVVAAAFEMEEETAEPAAPPTAALPSAARPPAASPPAASPPVASPPVASPPVAEEAAAEVESVQDELDDEPQAPPAPAATNGSPLRRSARRQLTATRLPAPPAAEAAPAPAPATAGEPRARRRAAPVPDEVLGRTLAPTRSPSAGAPGQRRRPLVAARAPEPASGNGSAPPVTLLDTPAWGTPITSTGLAGGGGSPLVIRAPLASESASDDVPLPVLTPDEPLPSDTWATPVPTRRRLRRDR